MDDAALADVREWLERGGYVLEMDVARRLLRRTNLVAQGEAYTDPVTGVEREIDVTALFLRFDPVPLEGELETRGHGIRLVIECKNTTAPWVGFVGHGGGNGAWSPRMYADYEGCVVCERTSEVQWGLRLSEPHVYAVTEKRARNTPDHAYTGVKQVVSAILAEYGGNSDTLRQDGHGDVQMITVMAVPVVVTASPLVLCSLDDQGALLLDPVERILVSVAGYELPDEATETDVWIVNIAGFEAFLDDLLPALEDEPQDEVTSGATEAHA